MVSEWLISLCWLGYFFLSRAGLRVLGATCSRLCSVEDVVSPTGLTPLSSRFGRVWGVCHSFQPGFFRVARSGNESEEERESESDSCADMQDVNRGRKKKRVPACWVWLHDPGTTDAPRVYRAWPNSIDRGYLDVYSTVLFTVADTKGGNIIFRSPVESRLCIVSDVPKRQSILANDSQPTVLPSALFFLFLSSTALTSLALFFPYRYVDP